MTATSCPITCQLGDTCGQALTGTDVSFSASPPWIIQAVQNSLAGYDKPVCLTCVHDTGLYVIPDKSFSVKLIAPDCTPITPHAGLKISLVYEGPNANHNYKNDYFSDETDYYPSCTSNC